MDTDTTTVCPPAIYEMWHSNQEGPKRHENAADGYDLRSVEFGTEIAHKGNHQQISCRNEKCIQFYTSLHIQVYTSFIQTFLTVIESILF